MYSQSNSLQNHPQFNPFLHTFYSSNAHISTDPHPQSQQQQEQHSIPIPHPPLHHHHSHHDDEPVSQPTQDSLDAVSVSPAAMFLSCFSPKVSQPPPPDSEGQLIAGYTLEEIIGHGGFSTIRRASSPTGSLVAVKIVRRSDLFKQGNGPLEHKRLQHEAAVWASLSHEHILPLFSAVHTPYADFFITLYCPAGSLFDILKRDGRPALPHDDAGMMFRQVVRGLRYMHEVAQYVHRDMKLENVLVDEMGICRIGDFGMTQKIGERDEEDEELQAEGELRQLKEAISATVGGGSHGTVHRALSLAIPSKKPFKIPSQTHRGVARHHTINHRNSTASVHPLPSPIQGGFQPGSLPYAAPELLLPPSSGVPILPHPAQDIWALGIILYALLTGRLPFTDAFEPRLHKKIITGVYEVPAGIGRGAERVLEACLDSDCSTRWSIDMVDEVAWGVGWGPEADGLDGEAEQEDTCEHETQSRSSSRATPEHADATETFPDWHADGNAGRLRTTIEAAERRSSSRAQRTMSRAPVMKPAGRSKSRHSRANSPGKLSGSALSASSSSSASSGYEKLSPISPTSGSVFLERGRRRQKVHVTMASPSTSDFVALGGSGSRSPSPSVAPTTPVDTHGVRFSNTFRIEDDDEEDRHHTTRHVRHTPPEASDDNIHPSIPQTSAAQEQKEHISDTSRGRRTLQYHHLLRRTRALDSSLTTEEGVLEVLEEDSLITPLNTAVSPSPSRSRQRLPSRVRRTEKGVIRRQQSTPPSAVSVWGGRDHHHHHMLLRKEGPTPPIMTPTTVQLKVGRRSKSVGSEWRRTSTSLGSSSAFEVDQLRGEERKETYSLLRCV